MHITMVNTLTSVAFDVTLGTGLAICILNTLMHLKCIFIFQMSAMSFKFHKYIKCSVS